MSAAGEKIDIAGLQSRIPLEDLVERLAGVELKRRGKELFGLCPLHTERTPSFTVTPAKQLWYCPGCSSGGDHVKFIMDYEGIGFVDAAKRLAELVGEDVPANDNRPPRERQAPREAPPPKWIKAMPPERAPEPPMLIRTCRQGNWVDDVVVSRWAYRDAAGALVGYTCRIEFERADGTRSKDVIPLCWQVNTGTGEAKWRQGAFAEPRPLYGAELLAHFPDRHVIVVEGEKAADAGRRMTLGTGQIVITWPGGCKAVDKADWSILAAHRGPVTLWPDTDSQADKRTGEMRPYREQPGMSAMLRIAEILAAAGKQDVLVLQVDEPGHAPDGWDAADAEAEGWDHDNVRSFIVQRALPAGEIGMPLPAPLDPEPEPEPEPQADEPEPGPDPKPEPAAPEPESARQKRKPPPGLDELDDRMPVRPLGYRHGHYYYLAARQRQVHEYSAGAHGPSGLLQLAPLSFWADTFAYGDTMKRDHWQAATDAMMRLCERAGIFDADAIRGRGCWIDRGRMVLNLGNRVLVDGEPAEFARIDSDYIYEADTRMPGPRGTPLTVAECARIIEIAKRFNWEMPASAALLLGWVVLAPICGALEWRPHVWLTGGSGTGKSTILKDFLSPLLAGMDVKVQGNSTEAGIRQRLRADARPVIFDESETNDEREVARVDAIMSLIRQASTDSDFFTFKGTTGGRELKFHVRSMFCLASIKVGIKVQADHTRTAVLSLYGANQVPAGEAEAHHAKWIETERMLAHLRDEPDFGPRLVQRSVAMADTIRSSMRTFRRVAAQEFRNQRLGDTYGTLLAGAYALFSDSVPADDVALKFIRTFDWSSYHEAAIEDESDEALSAIMQLEVRCDRERGAITLTVGELIDIVYRNSSYDGVSPTEARSHLGRMGIQVKRGIVGAGAGLLVANKSERLQKALRGARWANDWRSYLRRITGAKPHAQPVTFAPGYGGRATFVPIEAILKPEAGDG